MAKSKKRDDILKSALKLIVQHDLEHTSMDMIAKDARVGMGTIYNYFPSKEVLINELYRELVVQLKGAILNNRTDAVPLREQFFNLMRNKFYFYLEHLEIAQFVELYSYSPIITPEVQALAWEIWQIPVHLMDEGRKQQIIKDLPIEMLISLGSSPVFSLVKEHSQGRIQLDAPLIEAAITACWDAIKR